jgi:hypothetical protein
MNSADDDKLNDDGETIDEALRASLPEDPGQAREVLQDFSKALRRPVSTLYVMDAWADPFYVGDIRAKGAKWFARIWHDLGIPLGYHYRRIHYKMISQDTPIPFWRGGNYENTEKHWNELNIAARDAVALGLIPLDAFVDRRNPEPMIYLQESRDGQVVPVTGGEGILNHAGFYMPGLPRYGELMPGAGSFLPGVVPQPYHVEIWAEKSTMNDILKPLAQRYNAVLVTGVGELTATACRSFITRLDDRPARIIYISDFDPSGQSMPVAVARKIEFELYRQELDKDVQVRHIILTHAQCVRYELPRTPTKDTDLRAPKFEARFGEGATELDALEALHPGVFGGIVRKEIERYWNPDHNREVQEQIREFERELNEVQDGVYAGHRDEINAFRAEVTALDRQLQPFNKQAAALRERMKPVWQAMAEELEAEQPEPEIVCPDFDADEDGNPLFDSTRDYLTQINRYKAFQDKPTERKVRRRKVRPMPATPAQPMKSMTVKMPPPPKANRFTRGN